MTEIDATNPDMKTQLQAALADAEAQKDETSASTIRLLQSALEDREFCSKDVDCYELVEVMIEQRMESSRKYEESGHLDRAARELQEVEVLKRFLPEKLSSQQVSELAKEVIEDIDAKGLKDLGKALKAIKKKAPLGACPKELSTIVKQELASIAN